MDVMYSKDKVIEAASNFPQENEEMFDEMATEMFNEQSNDMSYDELISQFEEPVNEPEEEVELSKEEKLRQQREVLKQQIKIADKETYDEVKKLLEDFPQELKDLEIWCNWRFSYNKDGGKRKIPVNSLTGDNAKSNNPDTWSDFETALKRVNNISGQSRGLGLMLVPPYVGIDLDNIEEDVERHIAGDFDNNIVSEFAHLVDSYIETSPSGTGVHMIGKGILPDGRRHRDDVEMYNTTRFFTVTGRSIGPNHIKDDTDIGNIPKLHEKYLQKGDPVHVKVDRQRLSSEIGGNNLTDEEVVEVASRSKKQGEAFKKLFSGDWSKYKSQSQADLAFTNMLAYWTAKDDCQMDRIFRSSGLMRAKWDELRGNDTYGDMTIDKSLVGVKDVYNPSAFKSKVYGDDVKVYKAPKLGVSVKDEWKANKDEPILEESGEFPLRLADDTGNAERLIDRYGDIFKYHFKQGKYYVYNGQFWEKDDEGLARGLANHTVNAIAGEDWTQGIDTSTKEGQEALEKKQESQAKHVTRSRSRASKDNMLVLAQVYVPVNDDYFDQDNHLINTKNGYVDLRNGEFHKSNKDMMFSMMADAEYDKGAKPTKWLNFLDRVFDGNQELIDFIQRGAGYSLTGEINEEVLFLLLGDGGNGKSTFLETLKAALGSYTNNINVSSLGFRAEGSIKNDWAKLKGARLVSTSEPSKGFKFDEGQLKDMTGGEEVTSRFLFGEEFNYTPNFKLWIATNHKPVIVGEDDGIWRRFMLIPFDVKFEGKDKNDRLKQELLEELPGILQWAIDGAVEWYRIGLNPPTIVTDAVDEYRGDMDVIGKFIEENCIVGSGKQVKASEVWSRFKEWTATNLHDPTNHTLFGQEFVKRFDRKRTSSGNVYVGVELKK